MRGLLIVNPVAGSVTKDYISKVHTKLKQFLDEVVVFETSAKEQARRKTNNLKASEFQCLVSLGGDGTAQEVIQGMYEQQELTQIPPLLVLPGGTGNSFYAELWEDRPWEEAVYEVSELIGESHGVTWIDLIFAPQSKTVISLGAASGFLADVVEIAHQEVGIAVQGRDRYQSAAIQALGNLAPYPGRVSVDDKLIYEGLTTLVALGGAKRRGGTFCLLPLSHLDDGLLDVCVIASCSPQRFIELATLIFEGKHLFEPEVYYRQGKVVTLERTDGLGLKLEHDGECWDFAEGGAVVPTPTTVAFEVLPKIVPVFRSRRLTSKPC
ncbi:MAG: hypothetical protein M1483_04205 [Actinobacteria bacterium]|nr:hypothetical protein [Actinomycetota bacterium]